MPGMRINYDIKDLLYARYDKKTYCKNYDKKTYCMPGM